MIIEGCLWSTKSTSHPAKVMARSREHGSAVTAQGVIEVSNLTKVAMSLEEVKAAPSKVVLKPSRRVRCGPTTGSPIP